MPGQDCFLARFSNINAGVARSLMPARMRGRFFLEGSRAMLVLSREVGERIMVGDNIVITVTRISPNSVRLGIEAPKEMNIARDELIGTCPKIQPGPEDVEHIGRKTIERNRDVFAD